MLDSRTLILQYARTGSEAAFRQLVEGYMDLVYSTALRCTDGDRPMAEDIAQRVFLDLARKCGALSKEVMLGGWLHRRTCHVAATLLRSERRRKLRERRAAAMHSIQDHTEANLARIRPLLDNAVQSLAAKDRAAILLRFFEQQDFRTIGTALNCSEDAARVRVGRAIAKLQSILASRGGVLSAGALSSVLAGDTVHAAPMGLALHVAGAALTGATAGGGTTAITWIKIMTLSKLKLGLLGAAALALCSAPAFIQNHQLGRAQHELAISSQGLAQAHLDNARLSNRVAQVEEALSAAKNDELELLRLRGEVGQLRQQQKALAAAQPAVSSTPSPEVPAPANPGKPIPAVAKTDWKFVGYGTPEAALQSFAWSMREADLKFFLDSLTPEARQKVAPSLEGKSDNEIEAFFRKDLDGFEGLTFRRKTTAASNEVSFVVAYQESDNGLVKTHDEAVLTFRDLGGEWKCANP